MKKKKIDRFLTCCKKEIKRIWDIGGGPMRIVHYMGKCPKCGHFIGLTQTSELEAKKFLKSIK